MRVLALAVLSFLALASTARAQDSWSDPFPGVRRLHRRTSNQDVQVLVVDLCAPGVSMRATADGERRRTPSSFGSLVGAQAAVNGDFFNGSYSTDGPSMSGGAGWGGADHGYVAPIAFGDRRVSMALHEAGGGPEPWMREIVSGHPTILEGGAIRGSDDPLCTNRHPRTALGISADRRTFFLAVVDGRASTRIGMRCDELATLLRDLGAHDATNLDGGGSSAMWLAGAGVVSHPSDGSERVTANHLGLRATGSGPAAHCPNSAPDGYLDGAACDRIHGWSRDRDAPDTSIDAHVYIGGPAGDAAGIGYPLRADRARDDLCVALGRCEHAFEMRVPHGFMDGTERPVFAYGIDSMGGSNPLLANAPRMLRCERPALPYPPGRGVLRHVRSPAAFAAWRFDGHDVITMSDAELATFPVGDPLPDAPMLAGTDEDPRVVVVDGALLRHVPDPDAMEAWRFPWASIARLDAAAWAMLEEGAPIAARPWLVRGSGPEVYLLDAAPPLPELPDAGPTRDASVATDRDGGARDGGMAGRPDSRIDGGMSCTVRPARAGRIPLPCWLAIAGLIALVRRRSEKR